MQLLQKAKTWYANRTFLQLWSVHQARRMCKTSAADVRTQVAEDYELVLENADGAKSNMCRDGFRSGIVESL